MTLTGCFAAHVPFLAWAGRPWLSHASVPATPAPPSPSLLCSYSSKPPATLGHISCQTGLARPRTLLIYLPCFKHLLSLSSNYISPARQCWHCTRPPLGVLAHLHCYHDRYLARPSPHLHMSVADFISKIMCLVDHPPNFEKFRSSQLCPFGRCIYYGMPWSK